jgi:HK97 family phage portal protein
VRTRLLDGMDGYSTLYAGQRTIEINNNLTSYISNLFSGEGQIRGVFTRDNSEAIPEPIFQRIRQQFKELMNRFQKSTEPIILEGGVTFTPISAKPDEMELTKQWAAAINDMCRLFRMPPHKIFMLDGSKYENLETQEKMYVGDTLIPRAGAFEGEFGKKLFATKKDRLRYFFQFDRDEMTLRDTKVETERAVRALERGGITFDEFRARLGYNPFPNGQGAFRMIPANMVVVDENGKVVIAASQTDKPKDQSGNGADPAEQPQKGDGPRLVVSN